MTKHRFKPHYLWTLCSALFILQGCGTYKPCTEIEYVSVRPTVIKDPATQAEDAEIIMYGILNEDGDFDVVVENLTDDILTIDQTKSFFINNGKSTAYYDPTVRTTSNTTTVGSSSGKTFNLGGIANAFGIGGVAGSLLRATTVGGSNSQSNSTTYTEVVADMPQVSIGPRGRMALSKTFPVDFRMHGNFDVSTPEDSPCRFSVSINYSFDNGDSWDNIVSDYFVNSHIALPVTNRKTNDAVRLLISQKPNATIEPWFRLKSNRGYGYINSPAFINIK